MAEPQVKLAFGVKVTETRDTFKDQLQKICDGLNLKVKITLNEQGLAKSIEGVANNFKALEDKVTKALEKGMADGAKKGTKKTVNATAKVASQLRNQLVKAMGSASTDAARTSDAYKQLKDIYGKMYSDPRKDDFLKTIAKDTKALDDLKIKIAQLANALKDLNKEKRKSSPGGKSGGVLPDVVEAKDWSVAYETMTQKLSSFLSKMGLLGLATRYFRQMAHESVSAVKEINASLTQLSIITGQSWTSVESYAKRAGAVAKSIGSSISSVLQSSETYARLGYSLDTSLDLAKYTNIYSKVANVDVAAATSGITAIIKAFGVDASDAKNIEATLDVITKIGNSLPISSAEIGEALQNAAGSLKAANNTFEESVALTAAANQVVQNPSMASTALRTLSARLRNAKAELEELGEETENLMGVAKNRETILGLTGVDIMLDDQKFKSTYQILDELAAKWKKLSDANQAAVMNILAGTRQTNVVSSMLNNWKTAQDALNLSQKAAGTTADAQQKYLDSYEGRINRVTASAQELAQTIVSKDAVTTVTDLANGLVDVVKFLQDTKTLLPMVITLFSNLKGTLLFSNNRLVFNDSLSAIGDTGLQRRGINWKSTLTSWLPGRAQIDDLKNQLRDLHDLAARATEPLTDPSVIAKEQQLANGLNNIGIAGAGAARSITEGAKSGTAAYDALTTQIETMTWKTVGATIAASALKAALTAGLTFAISGIITLVSEWIRASERQAQAARESAQELVSTINTIEDYKRRIADLREQLSGNNLSEEDAIAVRKQLIALAPQIKDALGIEVDSVELLTNKVSDLNKALDDVAEKNAENWLSKNQTAINNSNTYLNARHTARVRYSAAINNESQSVYKAWLQALGANKDAGILATADAATMENALDALAVGVQDVLRLQFANGLFELSLEGTRREIVDKLTKFSTDFRAELTAAGISTVDGYGAALLSAVSNQIAHYDDSGKLAENEELYKQAQEYTAMSNEVYSQYYRDILAYQKQYEDALSSGESTDAILTALQKTREYAIAAAENDPLMKDYWTHVLDEFDEQIAAKKFEDIIIEVKPKVDFKSAGIGADTISEMFETYKQALEEGMTNPLEVVAALWGEESEQYKLFKNLIDTLEEAGYLLSDEAFGDLTSEGFVAALVMLGLIAPKASDGVDGVTKSVKDLTSQMQTAVSSMKELDTAMESISNGEHIDIDTISGLAEKFPELASGLLLYNSGVVSQAEALKMLQGKYDELSQTVIDAYADVVDTSEQAYDVWQNNNSDMIDEFAEQYGVDLSNANTWVEAKELLAKAFPEYMAEVNAKGVNALAEQYGIDLSNYKSSAAQQMRIAAELARAKAIAAKNAARDETGKIDKSLYDGNSEYRELLRMAVRLNDSYVATYADYSGLFGSGSKSSGSSGSSTDAVLDAWNKLLAEKRHLLAMDEITEEEYYDWLAANYKRYLADYEKYADQWKQYAEEIYKWQKQAIETAKRNIEDLLKLQSDVIKQQKNDEKKALQDQLKTLKDFYDKQKEMLKDQYDEEEYIREQAEKRKKVTDLELQMAELSNDNSAWAQKRLLELQQEYKDAKQDLDEFERKKSLEDAEQMYDDEYEAQERSINQKVDAIDEFLQNAKTLRDAALDDLKNGSKDLYDAMIEYNRQYGSAIDQDITDKWNAAYEALARYRAQLGGDYSGLNLSNVAGAKTTVAVATPNLSSVGVASSGGDTSSGGAVVAGGRATLLSGAQYVWSSGKTQSVPSRYIGGTYTVSKINGNRALISELNSWVDLAHLQRYASGTSSALGGLAITDEHGQELKMTPAGGGKYTVLPQGSKVFNAKATEFLYNLANNPAAILTKVPNIAAAFAGLTGRGKPTIQTGDIIIHGNVDERTVSQIRRAQQRQLEEIVSAFQRLSK